MQPSSYEELDASLQEYKHRFPWSLWSPRAQDGRGTVREIRGTSRSHSIGFSGGQLPPYAEGSSTLDFPLIHGAQSPDQL